MRREVDWRAVVAAVLLSGAVTTIALVMAQPDPTSAPVIVQTPPTTQPQRTQTISAEDLAVAIAAELHLPRRQRDRMVEVITDHGPVTVAVEPTPTTVGTAPSPPTTTTGTTATTTEPRPGSSPAHPLGHPNVDAPHVTVPPVTTPVTVP